MTSGTVLHTDYKSLDRYMKTSEEVCSNLYNKNVDIKFSAHEAFLE
jgi:hypothetical protein